MVTKPGKQGKPYPPVCFRPREEVKHRDVQACEASYLDRAVADLEIPEEDRDAARLRKPCCILINRLECLGISLFHRLFNEAYERHPVIDGYLRYTAGNPWSHGTPTCLTG